MRAKKRHEAKLKQKQIVVKEIKFRPGTDEGDYKIKLRNLVRFLEEGDKAKITLRFRGREMAHQEFGHRLIERVRNDLEPYSMVEQYPKMEGRQLIMVLAPKKVGGKVAAESAAKAGGEARRRCAGEACHPRKAAAEAAADSSKRSSCPGSRSPPPEAPGAKLKEVVSCRR